MLYNYKEVIEIYGTDYKLKQAIANKKIYRIESGIYSDKKDNFTTYELVLKKYQAAFLVKNSALYHIGFIEKEPDVIHLGTARNALRIRDKRVKQHFYGNFEKTSITSCHLYKIDEALTRKNIHTYISKENANELRLFNLSALFADLLRDRNTYSRQQLVELLEKFRDCKYFCDENLYYELDPQSVQFDLKLIELIEDVCSEARIRKWIQDWDIDWY